jgi:PAS domain S-box-containing protein
MSAAPATPVGLPTDLDAPALLDALADGAYVTDRERRILFWNRAAELILGWGSHEVVGRTCFDGLLAHVDKDGHQLCGQEHCPLHRSIVTASSSQAPLLVFAQSKRGDRVPVEVSVAPVRNAVGEVVGGIELFRDMTASMRDLWRARRIQEFALDCPLPEDERVAIQRCDQPHEIVGGDFCRVERCGQDAYVLLLADVMGHGVAAALYTMQLRSLWEDHRDALESPSRFLGVLNARLNTLVSDAGYFASAVCLRYDAATGDLRGVRAGHPTPLMVRAEGVARCQGKSQPALGMFPDTVYEEAADRLGCGDTLLLYTDGAVEIPAADGGELGEEGLARLVWEQAAAQGGGGLHLGQLEEALVRHCGQVHLPDDLALLALRRCR